MCIFSFLFTKTGGDVPYLMIIALLAEKNYFPERSLAQNFRAGPAFPQNFPAAGGAFEAVRYLFNFIVNYPAAPPCFPISIQSHLPAHGGERKARSAGNGQNPFPIR